MNYKCNDCEWAKLSTPRATGVMQVECLNTGFTLKKPFIPFECNRYQQKKQQESE